MSSDLLSTTFRVPILDGSLHDIEFIICEGMRPVLAANRHKIAGYANAVMTAVRKSFTDHRTSVRHLTAFEIRSRIDLAQQAAVIMYFEEKLSLARIYDVLANVLISTIMQGKQAGDLTNNLGTGVTAHRWGVKEAAPEICHADVDSDLNNPDSVDAKDADEADAIAAEEIERSMP